jgi:hypothetical protein
MVETISWSEIHSCLPLVSLKMVVHGYFRQKMGVVWQLIIDQRLIHLTPHVFPCHRPHSWISGGDHFLVKNLLELAFGIIENGRSWLFSTKMGVVWPLIID